MLAVKCDKCGETYARKRRDIGNSARLDMNIVRNLIFSKSKEIECKTYDLCPKCTANFFDWLNNTEDEEATDEEQENNVKG